jgi:hypothetical protein
MTDEYFEVTGVTHDDVEDLLVWWGERHSKTTRQSIEGISFGYDSSQPGGGRVAMYFTPDYTLYDENDPTTWTEHDENNMVEKGDRIYYRGNGVFELVKHEV